MTEEEREQEREQIYWIVREQRAREREAKAYNHAQQVGIETARRLQQTQIHLEQYLLPFFSEALSTLDTPGARIAWTNEPWTNEERNAYNIELQAALDEVMTTPVPVDPNDPLSPLKLPTSGVQNPRDAAAEAKALTEERDVDRAKAIRAQINLITSELAAAEEAGVRTTLENSMIEAAADMAAELEEEARARSADQNGQTRTAQARDLAPSSGPRTIADLPPSLPEPGTYDESIKIGVPSGDQVREAVNEIWDGKDFSDRIWNDKAKLEKALNDIITNAIINGEGAEETARKLAAALDSSLNNALRLVRTETNRILNKATLAQMKAAGIDKYRFIAIVDGRTCPDCVLLNGKIFPVDGAAIGVNYPPMHPNCRCTVAAETGAFDAEKSSETTPPESTPQESTPTPENIATSSPTQAAPTDSTQAAAKPAKIANQTGSKSRDWIDDLVEGWVNDTAAQMKEREPQNAEAIEAARRKVLKNANVDNVTAFAELENASQKRFEAKRQAVIERRRRRLRRDAGTHKKAKKKLSVKTPLMTDEERLQAWFRTRKKTQRNLSIEERQELKAKRAKLNKRQKKLNETLKTAGDYYEGSWKEIKISDISHLTALNNVEYMVFSKGNRRIIIKGGQRGASLTGELFDKIKNEGWKLSAHTHPHISFEGLKESTDDVNTLRTLNQEESVILNAIGEHETFNRYGIIQ